MPNLYGNPLIAKYGKGTRFGTGTCPHAAQRRAAPPWSMRNIVRTLAEFKPFAHGQEGEITVRRLLYCFRRRGEPVTVAHIMVAQLWVQAMTDYRAMNKLIDLVDGKLPKARHSK